MTDYTGDSLGLVQRLLAKAGEDALFGEAAKRIKDLEDLCAMMTDTGVILEEDNRSLIKADTWWLPDDGEVCWSSLSEALEEVSLPGDIVELARAHTLENCWAVLLEDIVDLDGNLVKKGGVFEFQNYSEAEEAVASHSLAKRRVEYGL